MDATSAPNATEVTWPVQSTLVIVASVYLVLNAAISLVLNALLLAVVRHSPSLATPPNNHLLNICTNDILLAVAMVLGVVGLHVNTTGVGSRSVELLSGLQFFLVVNSLLQYWGTFGAIGHYRQKTTRQPAMPLRERRHLVSLAITVIWLLCSILALIFALAFSETASVLSVTQDPLRRSYRQAELDSLTAEQGAIGFLVLLTFALGLGFIVRSYYSICRTLSLTRHLGNNRVMPCARHLSADTTDGADLMVANGRSYLPSNDNPPSTTCFNVSEACMVQYRKADHSLTFDLPFSLENPMLTSNLRPSVHTNERSRPRLQVKASTISTTSQRSHSMAEFTDISMGANLERMSEAKRRSALHHQCLRRDRISLSSAAKNSLVMMALYLGCTLPLVLCSLPGVLSAVSPHSRLVALLLSRLLFFANAPAYPLWYLLFSKRVKKCPGPNAGLHVGPDGTEAVTTVEEEKNEPEEKVESEDEKDEKEQK